MITLLWYLVLMLVLSWIAIGLIVFGGHLVSDDLCRDEWEEHVAVGLYYSVMHSLCWPLVIPMLIIIWMFPNWKRNIIGGLDD